MLLFFLFFFLVTLSSRWALSDLTSTEATPLAVDAQSPNHWTARPVPCVAFYISNYGYFLYLCTHPTILPSTYLSVVYLLTNVYLLLQEIVISRLHWRSAPQSQVRSLGHVGTCLSSLPRELWGWEAAWCERAGKERGRELGKMQFLPFDKAKLRDFPEIKSLKL